MRYPNCGKMERSDIAIWVARTLSGALICYVQPFSFLAQGVEYANNFNVLWLDYTDVLLR